jgi:hypothetical protein
MSWKRAMVVSMACALGQSLVSLTGCSSEDDHDTVQGEPKVNPGEALDGGETTLDAGLTDARAARSDARTNPNPRDHGDAAVAVEVCDGIDNDGDGRVDDVDVGSDGICDCLLLATLGKPGIWGEGDVFAQWLSRRSNNGAAKLTGKTLTPALLAPYQVIVAEDLSGETYADAEIAALQDWIRGGGGLFTLIGYADAAERTQVNKILAPTGLQYGATPAFTMQINGKTAPVETWSAHPVSEGITKVGVHNGYEVQGSGTQVASQGGVVALRVSELGAGHVLVWADEWITYDSEWSEHPEYQVERFWLNSIKWLTAPKECQVPIPIAI